MKIEIENVDIIYPNEDTGVSRNLLLRSDFEFLHIDIMNVSDDEACITLSKEQVEQLRDSLNMILKNKLLD